MKLEDVLPSLRMGKKIRRNNWCKDTYIYINSYGKFQTQSGRPFEIILDCLYDLEKDCWEIVKEKKKVKLRDLTEEQCCRWVELNCEKLMVRDCEDCPFAKVVCTRHVPKWRFYHQDIFNDKFLDQEIEIED